MFGGGMGRQGYVCGAAVGGLMVLGLRYGFTQPQDKLRSYEIAAEFMRRFHQHNGAVNCRDLLGVDISNPQIAQQAKEDGTFARVCPKAIRNAVEVVSEMLQENNPSHG
jgi:C_GCAxxG_C_C family probable redox protein